MFGIGDDCRMEFIFEIVYTLYQVVLFEDKSRDKSRKIRFFFSFFL